MSSVLKTWNSIFLIENHQIDKRPLERKRCTGTKKQWNLILVLMGGGLNVSTVLRNIFTTEIRNIQGCLRVCSRGDQAPLSNLENSKIWLYFTMQKNIKKIHVFYCFPIRDKGKKSPH